MSPPNEFEQRLYRLQSIPAHQRQPNLDQPNLDRRVAPRIEHAAPPNRQPAGVPDLYALDPNPDLQPAAPVREAAARSSASDHPRLRRILSAGRLLFQIVGLAGYAGYFMGMHTLMRLVSGTLLAATWYAIYRIKSLPPPA